MTSLSDQILLGNLTTSVRVLTQLLVPLVHDRPTLLGQVMEEIDSQAAYFNEYKEASRQEHAEFLANR